MAVETTVISIAPMNSASRSATTVAGRFVRRPRPAGARGAVTTGSNCKIRCERPRRGLVIRLYESPTMSLKIDQDHSRFRAIVRGKIRQNLRKYISQGELIGRKGKDLVSIPIPQIDLPHFSFGDRQRGGAGQGEGDPGDPMGGDQDGEEGDGKQAGSAPGEHALEVDVTLDE